MSEPGNDAGGSTSLKESFEMYRTEHRREHETAHSTHDKEHQLREEQTKERQVAMDHRLEGMNEVRGAMADLSARMATKEYVEGKLSSIDTAMDLAAKAENERVKKIEDELIASRSLIALVPQLENRVKEVEQANVKQAGQRGGTAATISYIVLALGAAGMIIGLFSVFAGQ